MKSIVLAFFFLFWDSSWRILMLCNVLGRWSPKTLMEEGWVGQVSKQQAHIIKEANPGVTGDLSCWAGLGACYDLSTSESPWPRYSRGGLCYILFPIAHWLKEIASHMLIFSYLLALADKFLGRNVSSGGLKRTWDAAINSLYLNDGEPEVCSNATDARYRKCCICHHNLDSSDTQTQALPAACVTPPSTIERQSRAWVGVNCEEHKDFNRVRECSFKEPGKLGTVQLLSSIRALHLLPKSNCIFCAPPPAE